MTNIESYDLGWMVIDTIHAAHFYRTNSQSKVALSHCGVMLPKADLRAYKGANRCGYCRIVQTEKDRASVRERQAISPNKPLPVGVQTGKKEK